MIDIHSHILFGIDDGCSNINDAIKTLKLMKNMGFDKLVLTPHYIKGSNYSTNNLEKKRIFKELYKKVLEENIDVELFLGNEIFINGEIDELIRNHEIYSINNSRYLLIELPLNNQINSIEDYLYELRIKGYIPIIAHPERYSYFQENPEDAKKLYESGILFQCNYGSIMGQYGKSAMKLFIYLLENNMVSFLSSDVHRPTATLFSNFKDIKDKIEGYVGKEQFRKISHDNALRVLNDEDVIHENVKNIRINKGFFRRGL